jgi:catalase
MAFAAISFPAAAQTAPAATPVSPQAIVDAFDAAGAQPGFRRSGARGICAEGHFTGTLEGRAISSASAFSGERIPVIARFSVGGGNPQASEKAKTTRGLALDFTLPNNQKWQMANISAPVFMVSTPENMLGFLESRKLDPETKKPDPAKVAAFNAAHPDVKPQMEWLAKHGVPASYAAVNYWGVNAFKFINDKGQTQYARWVFEPVGGQELLDDEKLKQMPDHFLADELRKRVAAKPAEFNFRLQLAEQGDDLVNSTVQWPETRKMVTAGRLVIEKVESGAGGACDPITYNPLKLPKGIEPSEDPILLARPAPYAISLSRRLSGK